MACPRLSLDSTPQSSPATLAVPASPAVTASAARLALAGGWSRSDNAEGGGRREEELRDPDGEGEEGGAERPAGREEKKDSHTEGDTERDRQAERNTRRRGESDQSLIEIKMEIQRDQRGIGKHTHRGT